MKDLPFQKLIDVTSEFSILLRNKQKFDIEYEYTKKIDTKLHSINVKAEINGLRSELLKIDDSRQFLYVKLILNDLIHSYSSINSIERIEEEDKYCKSLFVLTLYQAIGDIIELLKDMNISISADFIQFCERRKDTNPIGMIINTLKKYNLIYAKSTSSKSKILITPNLEALEGKYKFIKNKPNYLEKYLDSISEHFDIKKKGKQDIAAIALILYEKQLFNKCNTYISVLLCCCEYWGCNPPAESGRKPSLYRKLADDYLKYAIFNTDPLKDTN